MNDFSLKEKKNENSYNDFDLKTKKKLISPSNINQKDFIGNLMNYDLTFGIGPAGTGKTYVAIAVAVARDQGTARGVQGWGISGRPQHNGKHANRCIQNHNALQQINDNIHDFDSSPTLVQQMINQLQLFSFAEFYVCIY